MANGSAVAQAQAVPTMSPTVAAPAPLWLQMLPIPGTAHYYLVPQPGMTWPAAVPPQYPVPMPLAAPASWVPFVWVLVPVPAMPTASAVVDYGPVADTPVVELPQSDEAPAGVSSEHATHLPTAETVDQAASASRSAPLVPAPVLAKATSDVAALAPAPSVARPESAVPAVMAPLKAIAVNYGPVAPTPVVNLLALEKRAAAARSPSIRAKSKVVRRAAANSAKPLPVVAAKPVKRRLCWTNGVVAPCH